MASDISSQSEFPPQLASVPEEAVVYEAFGWAPASWAIALVGVPAVVFVQPAKPSATEYVTAAGIMLLGGLLLGYEFRRRNEPRALVRFDERFGLSPNLGFYKRGQLEQIVPVENVNLYLRHPGKTWGLILYSAMCALFCIAFPVASLTGGPALDRAAWLLLITGSMFFSALLGSVMRTRLFCEELLFPRKGPRGLHRMLVRKTAIPKLLSRRDNSSAPPPSPHLCGTNESFP